MVAGFFQEPAHHLSLFEKPKQFVCLIILRLVLQDHNPSFQLPVQPRFTLPSSTIFFFRLSPDSRSLATLEVVDGYTYGDELGLQRRGPARLWDSFGSSSIR